MIRGLLLIVIIGLGSASAQATQYYMSPFGTDTGVCVQAAPCRTLPYVCNLITASPGGGNDSVALSDGTYAGGCNITYYHVVNITGNCTLPGNTLVDPTNTVGFQGQDHAILVLNCLTLHSDTSNGTGLSTRQFAIADYSNVRFGAMQVHVSAMEKSKINCLSATIFGNAVYHVMASGQSAIILSCPISILAGGFSSFAWVGQMSEVYAYGSTITGTNTGYKYILDGLSMGAGVSSLPGSGSIVQNGSIVE